MVHDSFGPLADVILFNEYRAIPRVVGVRFPHSATPSSQTLGPAAVPTHPYNGTIVLAIKGTSTAADAYIDIGMYSAVRALQEFSRFVPLVSLLPSSMLAWFES